MKFNKVAVYNMIKFACWRVIPVGKISRETIICMGQGYPFDLTHSSDYSKVYVPLKKIFNIFR